MSAPVSRRVLRAVTLSLTVLLASVGLVGGVSAPAHAAGCYFTSCQNLDPQGTGCSVGAKTIGVIASGQTEIRWSPTCQAGWLRQNNQTFAYAGTLELYSYYKDYYNGSYYGGFVMRMPAGHNGNWTKMVPMSTPMFAQAHINLYWSGLYNTN